MKPWVWLLFSALTLVGSIYLWKKPASTPNAAPAVGEPSPVETALPGAVPQTAPGGPPLNRNIPAPRGPVMNNSGDNPIPTNPPNYNEPYGQPPNNEENNPNFPSIPPPPPPPIAPFPDSEPPEFFDGDSAPPPFEPPPPLDEGGFVPPPSPPMGPEGVE